MDVRIGCSGWPYVDWVGPFYPAETGPGEFLKLYSKIFDCVEIDSTFYRVPSENLVKQWKSSAPEGFTFCPKIPKRITHDLHLEGVREYLDHFTNRLGLLDEKLGPFVVQMPPSFKLTKHLQLLSRFVEDLNLDHRFVIEFRHKSWFNEDVLKLLQDKNICQVWSVNQYLTTPAARSADTIYLRFVGDRTISKFNKLQKDQRESMKEWSRKLKDVNDSTKDRFVFFNNHFAGFYPGSANEFRRLMGLAELDWTHLALDSAQRTMLDF